MNSNLTTNLYFESKAEKVPADTFRVIGFEGQEEISRPFRFKIELASEKPDIDVEDLLRWPAFLGIERDGEMRKIHGVLAEFEQNREGPLDLYHYRAVLVPRLWLLSMSSQNQIYQNKSVPEIVEEELKGARNKGPAELAAAGLTAEDFELRLTQKYAAREYTVQYQESDLDFISRLMEHEGIFYFFEYDDNKEKIIITDNNIHFPAIAGESTILYRPPSGMAAVAEESIRSISCRNKRVPKKVILKDYNYRTPHVPLQGEVDVDTKGHGLISEYGNHFKKPEEGIVLARIRAEEIRCRRKIFEGEGDCSQFRSGHRYTLDEHYREDFNGEYVITGVSHTGTQPIAGASGTVDKDREQPSYRNMFTAIPSDIPFRPERRTPKPRLYGIMHAHVDSALLQDRAEIDEQGRYKVVMPFDLSGSGEGKASRFIRMAQPYGGKSHGMHFPLHKGTEVIWACIDGDPDRPIIIGTVPNPLNPSVVTDSNYTKNVIRTASGSFLEFNDGPGPSGIIQKATGSQLQQQQQYQKGEDGREKNYHKSLGLDLNSKETEDNGQREDALVTLTDTHIADYQGKLEEQRQKQTYDTIEEAGGDSWFRVKVPDWVNEKDSYLRLGAGPSQQQWGDTSDETDDKPAGWFDYTDGVHTSISGETVDPTESTIYNDPTLLRAVPPDVDAAMWTEYRVNNSPPSPYSEYTLGKDFWKPALNKDAITTVIASKDTRYYPYWEENTSKRQQYESANTGTGDWRYFHDVIRDDLVRGSHNEHVLGDRMTLIEGTWTVDVKGHLYNTAWGHVHSDYYQSHSESYYDDVLDVYGQPDTEVTVTEIAYGPKYEWHFGNKVEVVEGDIFEYHDGNKTEYVVGDFEEKHEGSKTSYVSGKVEETYAGEVTQDFKGKVEETLHAGKKSTTIADNLEFIFGMQLAMFFGLKLELSPDVNIGVEGLVINKGAVNMVNTGLCIKKEDLKTWTGASSIFM
jgi:type VI secretion system VgrG family protein